MPSDALTVGADGRPRCFWAVGGAPEYVAYHDDEWGRPVLDDDRLFERLTLEAFQSGLSWLTILRKRAAFRAAFAGFDIAAVAAFGEADKARLLADAGIVRNRLKIEAAIANARAALPVIEEHGSLAAFFWRFRPEAHRSAALAGRLRRREPRVGRAGQGPQEARLSLRRPDHRLLPDAGRRHRQRPRRRLRRRRRGRATSRSEAAARFAWPPSPARAPRSRRVS